MVLLAGCARPPGSEFAFGVLGDTPYTLGEVHRLDALIDDMNAEKLDFVVHLGDIGSSVTACDDAWLEARKAQFARLRHKLVVIPGDNEWTDCRDPPARLAAWRKLFCPVPLEVERQAGEYCEHMRWVAAGFLFVTLNVTGSNNNVRNAAEHRRRMAAVYAWLDESASLAQKGRVGLIILIQANPFISLPRDGFQEMRERLIVLGQKMSGRVMLVHGDSHTYHDDEPIPGMRRLEVWGSPIVSWIRGELDAGELRFTLPRLR
ncbi:MAG TPA: metallophosphoesterase [Burkholderiales bacterium]|nr:metallophosphoesterase [Burkholderiales bacterium]